MEIEVVVVRWRDAVRISRWIAKSEAEGERLRLIHSVGLLLSADENEIKLDELLGKVAWALEV
jgi:hypothetical protein